MTLALNAKGYFKTLLLDFGTYFCIFFIIFATRNTRPFFKTFSDIKSFSLFIVSMMNYNKLFFSTQL